MNLIKHDDKNFSQLCVWTDMFNDDERITLQEGFLVTGLLSIVFSGWLSKTILLRGFYFDNSYRNLANFTSIACIRRFVPTLLGVPLVQCIGTLYGIEIFTCNILAFFESFLAVFEVEVLTHVCIERYVIAKYLINGWQTKRCHYKLYLRLSLLFACLYSIPPLFGIGRYGFDFQCTTCTFDIILPDTWQRYIVVAIFLLRSIKPAVVMTMMLMWARDLEKKNPSVMKQHIQFTRHVIVIVLVNVFCWFPIFLVRGIVILSQLMYLDVLPMWPGFYVKWALWIHWVAPAISTIALISLDGRVRDKMLNLRGALKIENEADKIK